jgi:hypothetical protein
VQQTNRPRLDRSRGAAAINHPSSITCPTGMVRRKDCQDMPVWSATPATPATPVIACRNDSQDARGAAETTASLASLAHMVRATPMPRRPCPVPTARPGSPPRLATPNALPVACQPDKVLGSIARLFLFRLGLCCLVPAVHPLCNSQFTLSRLPKYLVHCQCCNSRNWPASPLCHRHRLPLPCPPLAANSHFSCFRYMAHRVQRRQNNSKRCNLAPTTMVACP